VWTLGTLAHLLITAAGLTVQGEGRGGCPNATDVSARLAALLPGESSSELTWALVLDSDGYW
jgi:hypothetical protein